MDNIVLVIPIMAIVGLVVMALKSRWVSKQDAGDKDMEELSDHIHSGAMAFLRAEWRVLAYYTAIAAIVLAWSSTSERVNSHWIISISFILGAVFSALAGYFGMNIATRANVRTTQAARSSLAKALKVSFNGGTV
ncbi:MAG: sodium-translocating pyrophosphatase, partial [Saprospiraceae bacterium]|nr:sodium-translocating pyrophosphatase [Saprospiraceae bacterium]